MVRDRFLVSLILTSIVVTVWWLWIERPENDFEFEKTSDIPADFYKLWVEDIRLTYEHHNSNSRGTIGFLIVALGWVISSETAQKLIKRRSWIYAGILVLVAAYQAFHGYIIFSSIENLVSTHAKAREYYSEMETLICLSPNPGLGMRIDGTMHMLLFVFTYCIFCTVGKSEENEGDVLEGMLKSQELFS